MVRFLVIGILASITAAQAEAKIYRWTDSSGEVHFSDQPHKGAETVDLPPVQTYSPPVQPEKNKANSTNDNKDEQPLSPSYKAVRIVQPTPEATIRNNQGLVPILVEVEPKLKKSDKVQLIFDGKPIGSSQNSTSFTLTDVYRGAHTVSVQILSDSGSILNESEPVTFYMHRPRVGMGNIPSPGGR